MVHYSDFGVDSRIQRQARALAERGDQVHLVCLSPSSSVLVGKGEIHVHGVMGEKAGGGAASYLKGYGSFFVRALRRVSALDAAAPFDLVEAHNMPDFLTLAALRPKRRGAPVILNVHDTFPELFATKFGDGAPRAAVSLLRLEERWSAALADAVVVVTSEAGDILNARGVGVDRTTVIMNTPDERLFGPQREAQTLPADGPIRALYHGGLASRFGVELLIGVVGRLQAQLPRLELRVCGTGSEHRQVAAVAEQAAPGCVDVEPAPVALERIPGELRRAHLGIVPTLRDDFTEHLLPVKLLEYVHMGMPAVAPRLPVIEHYFDDSQIRFFEPGSAEDLAAAIADVCGDPARARERAARAASRLAAIGWPHQRRTYLELVDRLTAGKRPTKVRPLPPRSSHVPLFPAMSAHGTNGDH